MIKIDSWWGFILALALLTFAVGSFAISLGYLFGIGMKLAGF